MRVLRLSKSTARRYIMGKQGLWPGRRWEGLDGTDQALSEIQALQMDPLNIVARSHDLALFGRVLNYQPLFLDQKIYQERRFFDYGGGLFIYPMSELPYWRLHMQRTGQHGRVAEVVKAYPEVVAQVLQAVRERGPLGNRDFNTFERAVQGNYRGTKQSAIALYYLWLKGELMIHHRVRFERVYDLRERVVPANYDYAAQVDETEAFFARKAVEFLGLISERGWIATLADYIQRRVEKEEGHTWLDRLVRQGELLQVEVETAKTALYMPAGDLPWVELLQRGEIPPAWQPLGPTTLDEVTILAPLEIVSARGRSAWLFDFEYIWEVYKPANLRRWGYYTVPVLYGDKLVARLDPKLDRKTGVLQILGYWLEDAQLKNDKAYHLALERGLQRLGQMVGAKQIDLAEGMKILI